MARLLKIFVWRKTDNVFVVENLIPTERSGFLVVSDFFGPANGGGRKRLENTKPARECALSRGSLPRLNSGE